jgi:hypothetical protein
MVKFEDRRVKEVEIKDAEDLLNAPLNEIQMIKGSLTAESNLSELVEEAKPRYENPDHGKRGRDTNWKVTL